MATKQFGPVTIHLVKSDNITPHGQLTALLTTNNQDREHALTIDLDVSLLDGRNLKHKVTMRRDMVFNFPKKIRDELRELKVVEHGEHAEGVMKMFSNSPGFDRLFTEIRQSLNIDPMEPIDLDRMLKEGY